MAARSRVEERKMLKLKRIRFCLSLFISWFVSRHTQKPMDEFNFWEGSALE